MPNIFLTDQVIADMTLVHLSTRASTARLCNKDYIPQFTKPGYKIGDMFSVPKPVRFIAGGGLAYDPQPIVETTTPVTVTQVTKIHYEIDAVQQTLQLMDRKAPLSDRQFAKLKEFGESVGISLLANINKQCAEYIALNTPWAAGTPGTTPTSTLTYMRPLDILIEQGMPESRRANILFSRNMSSTFVNAVQALFNPAGELGKQYQKGEVQKATEQLGYIWNPDQSLYRHTIGAYAGTPTVNGAQSADGGYNVTMSLVTQAWTNNTSVLKAGDRFTIANVFAVDPQTKQSNGRLQVFVNLSTQTASAGGAKTLTISPAITVSGPYQNVDAAAANGAAITVLGAASTVTECAIVMTEDAYAFISVPFDQPTEGVVGSAISVDPETKMAISYIRAYDNQTRAVGTRFDVLWDISPLYREQACILYSAGTPAS